MFWRLGRVKISSQSNDKRKKKKKKPPTDPLKESRAKKEEKGKDNENLQDMCKNHQGLQQRSNFARLVKGKIHINSGGQKVKRSSLSKNYFCLRKHFFISRTPYFRFLEGIKLKLCRIDANQIIKSYGGEEVKRSTRF